MINGINRYRSSSSPVRKPSHIVRTMKVQLPCNCRYDADHSRGGRFYECSCGNGYIVHASTVTSIKYEVEQTRSTPVEKEG